MRLGRLPPQVEDRHDCLSSTFRRALMLELVIRELHDGRYEAEPSSRVDW